MACVDLDDIKKDITEEFELLKRIVMSTVQGNLQAYYEAIMDAGLSKILAMVAEPEESE